MKSKKEMMQSQCMKAKIKEGCLNDVKNWFYELNNRKKEVIETLENEGIIFESAFIDNINNNYYLIYYIKAQDLKKAFYNFVDSKLPIDIYYKESWKKFIENVIQLEPLLDVDLIE